MIDNKNERCREKKFKMKFNNIVLLLVMFLVTLVCVSAEQVYEQETYVDLKINCFDNNTYCDVGTICGLTVFSPSNALVVDNVSMSNNGAYHNYTLNSTHTSELGDYIATTVCWSGDQGYSSFDFKITPSGKILEDNTGYVYAMIIIISLVMMIVFLLVGSSKETENKYSVDGKYVEINYGKYLKIVMYFLAYMSFLLSNFLVYQVTQNTVLTFASEVFRVFFMMTIIMLIPISIGIIIKTSLDIFKDWRDIKITKEGLSVFMFKGKNR